MGGRVANWQRVADLSGRARCPNASSSSNTTTNGPRYAREAVRIRSALATALSRSSTWVRRRYPGLAAKPVIDILLVVADSAGRRRLCSAASGRRLHPADPQKRRCEHAVNGPVAGHLRVRRQAATKIERMLSFRIPAANAADRDLYARRKRDWQNANGRLSGLRGREDIHRARNPGRRLNEQRSTQVKQVSCALRTTPPCRWPGRTSRRQFQWRPSFRGPPGLGCVSGCLRPRAGHSFWRPRRRTRRSYSTFLR